MGLGLTVAWATLRRSAPWLWRHPDLLIAVLVLLWEATMTAPVVGLSLPFVLFTVLGVLSVGAVARYLGRAYLWFMAQFYHDGILDDAHTFFDAFDSAYRSYGNAMASVVAHAAGRFQGQQATDLGRLWMAADNTTLDNLVGEVARAIAAAERDRGWDGIVAVLRTIRSNYAAMQVFAARGKAFMADHAAETALVNDYAVFLEREKQAALYYPPLETAFRRFHVDRWPGPP